MHKRKGAIKFQRLAPIINKNALYKATKEGNLKNTRDFLGMITQPNVASRWHVLQA